MTGGGFLFSGLIRMMDFNFLGSLTPRCYSETNGRWSRSTFPFRDPHAFPPGPHHSIHGSSKLEARQMWETCRGGRRSDRICSLPRGSLKRVAGALFHCILRNPFGEMVFLYLDKMNPFRSVYFYSPHVKECWRN